MELLDIIGRDNADYVETLYQQYLKDPRGLDERWVALFFGSEVGYDGLALARTQGNGKVPSPAPGLEQGCLRPGERLPPPGALHRQPGPAGAQPLGASPARPVRTTGSSAEDLHRQVGSGGFLGPTSGILRDLISKLRATYCETLGAEYRDIPDKAQRDWM